MILACEVRMMRRASEACVEGVYGMGRGEVQVM